MNLFSKSACLLFLFGIFLFPITSAADAPPIIILDSDITPFGISSENSSVQVDVTFGVLQQAGPPMDESSWELTWEVAGTPLVNTSHPTITIASRAETLTDTGEYYSIISAGGPTVYIVERFSHTYNPLSGPSVFDDRYATSISATLTIDNQNIGSTSDTGANLAVMLNLGTSTSRLGAAEDTAESGLPSLGAGNNFTIRKSAADDLGFSHFRWQQYYNGVKVLYGEVISHVDDFTNVLTETSSEAKSGIQIGTTPNISSGQSITNAQNDMSTSGLTGTYLGTPSSELVIYQDVNMNYRLAYNTHNVIAPTSGDVVAMDHIIDALTGSVITKWQTTQNLGPVDGTARTQYTGNNTIKTNSISGGYEMKDTTRAGGAGIRVFNCQETFACSNVFFGTNNDWGDNNIYQGNPNNVNGETAAADAMFGMQKTYDYWKTTHARNSYNGANGPFSAYAHQGPQQDPPNARWDVNGIYLKSTSSGDTSATLDIIGHEFTHGVIIDETGFPSAGEADGLSEAIADLFGAAVEAYAANPADPADWLIGEELIPSSPIRYMTQPSLHSDIYYKDFWYTNLKNLSQPHYRGAPADHFMYYLAKGVPPCSSCTTNPNCGCNGTTPPECSGNKSPYLPCGMTGINRVPVEKIVYRAIRFYFTATETYQKARTDTLKAAKDIYGNPSSKYTAVNNAWKAINVQ